MEKATVRTSADRDYHLLRAETEAMRAEAAKEKSAQWVHAELARLHREHASESV